MDDPFSQALIATAIALESGAIAKCDAGHLICGTGDYERAIALALLRFQKGSYRPAFDSEEALRAAVERVILDHPSMVCACSKRAHEEL